jgi:hypothetical protein
MPEDYLHQEEIRVFLANSKKRIPHLDELCL